MKSKVYDEIVEEVRKNREAYAAKFNFNLQAMYVDLKKAERKSKHKKVSLKPKKSVRKKIDPIPEEFSSYEEAAEFWDKHDTTKYLQSSRPVKVISELRERRYEIQIDENIAQVLRKAARKKGITPSRLANDLLRQRLATRV